MSLATTNIGPNPETPGIAAEIFLPDQLIAGDAKVVSHGATFLTGQGVIARGTVVGLVTSSQKYIKSVQTASDGSQTALAIVADTVDTTAGDALGGVYLSGEFNSDAMTFDASWTLQTTLRAALRNVAIWLKVVSGAMTNADPT